MNEEDLHQIAQDAEDAENTFAAPEVVPGRILIMDGDVLSYKACDLDSSYASNVENLKDIIQIWKSLAGAEYIELHVTLGHKGDREEIATVQEYQGKRKKNRDQDKVARVRDLRLWMGDHVDGKPQHDQEADDSMTQAMYGYGKRAVLMTPDKDLNVVPGLRIDVNSFAIIEQAEGYGKCTLLKTPSNTKVVGSGTSFFWHQLLMGDSADDIPGLPLMAKELWMKYCPTKKIAGLQQRVSSGRTAKGTLLSAGARRKTLQMMDNAYKEAVDKTCGPVMAHRYLQSCRTDKEAYRRCLDAYRAHYGDTHHYYTWDNILVTDATALDMMIEQARLLWMRRVHGEDVAEWFKEING